MNLSNVSNAFMAAAVSIAVLVPIQTVTAGEKGSFGGGGGNLITSVPRIMTYQGILKDSGGDPVTDSVYNVTFRIFDVESGGTSLWDETLPCSTSAGVFLTAFGDVNLPFDQDYWLELEVGGEILDPRQKMSMVGYAARSDTCDAALDIADDVVTSAKIQDGTIQFIDIGSNGAGPGHIIKWNGSAWVLANDEIGSGNGWADDGNVVRLLNGQDSVGIGTSNPLTNFHVMGNLFVGPGHADSAFYEENYCIMVGKDHINRGTYNSITGGRDNEVITQFNHIGGGYENTISSYGSFIGGGYNNADSGHNSTIGGGSYNRAVGERSTIGGGSYNRAVGEWSTIGGGGGPDEQDGNQTYGILSFIGGGLHNTNHSTAGFIGAGLDNVIDSSAEQGVILGGYINRVIGDFGFIGGGVNNEVDGNFGSVLIGESNISGGWSSGAWGGESNEVYGDYSIIFGGLYNVIDSSADNSYLFGNNSTLTQPNTFMVNKPHIRFGDESSGYEIPTTDGAAGQVLSTNGTGTASWTDLSGGSWISEDTIVYLAPDTARVGIGTSAPGEKLEVDGNIKATGTIISGNSITIDGTSDEITASGGNISFGDENVITTGKASIGPGNTNSGVDAFVAGNNNEASGNYSSVGGGGNNNAYGIYSVIGGGGGVAADSNSAFGEYSVISGGSRNITVHEYTVVGGGLSNRAHWEYSTVSGGRENLAGEWYTSVGGGRSDTASGQYSVIGGGSYNTASNYWTTVGGGTSNVSSGQSSTVGGGNNNTASGLCSFIPGGCNNLSSGNYAFASGSGAKALHNGSFVWADASNDDFASTNENQIMMLASGGTWIYADPELKAGVTIHPGASAWSTYADGNLKENMNSVDGKDILRKISSLPINEWNLKAQSDNIRHIGPTAQDFHGTFGLGEDDQTISTVDADGVALAGIKELIQENQELRDIIAQLEKRITELENK